MGSKYFRPPFFLKNFKVVYKVKVRFSPNTNEQKGACKVSKLIKNNEYLEITIIKFEVIKNDINFHNEGVFLPFEVYKQTINAVINYFNIRYNRPIKIELEDAKFK